jgi:hypothetical protein
MMEQCPTVERADHRQQPRPGHLGRLRHGRGPVFLGQCRVRLVRAWLDRGDGRARAYVGVLASNPETNGSGTISARKVYDFADSIRSCGDTPN